MAEDYKLELHPQARPEAVVQGERYRFTVLTAWLIRMEHQPDGKFTDSATQTVLCRDFPVPDYRVIDRGDTLEIATDALHLYYDKKPFSPQGLHVQLREGFQIYGSNWSYGDELHTLKGTARTLDQADGAIPLEEGLMSLDGFAVMDDSGTALLRPDMWIEPRAEQCQDLYFFGYGHDYMRCLKDFYRLTGMPPLLPRYALGNWWSRFHKYTEESYLELMEKFQAKEVPFSVAVIDMDWHVTNPPKECGSGWTGYTWDRALFPDPARFLRALHDMGMHVTLNVHPADGVRSHEEAYGPMAAAMGVDAARGDKIPFEAADKKFMEAYFKYLHHPHEAMGVDFWWVDWQQGTLSSVPGMDPLWMLNHLHYIDSGRAGKTPLTFSRYAGIGSHRYPIGFSGDSFATWETLDFQPYFTATASNVGYSWWSHDIGGHTGGRRDDELAARWVQFGVFSPIMRLHSTDNLFQGKEPWNFGAEAERVMTAFLRLRHALVPYIHSMNWRTHLFGEPIVQPLYFKQDVPESYIVPNEYWFGTEMIVCPITRPMSPDTLLGMFDAWLPQGTYFDLFTGQLYRGGRRLKLYRDISSIPVLVKAGGIIPMDAHPHSGDPEDPEELKVLVYQGADGAFDMYEGESGAPTVTRFAFTPGKNARFTVEADRERIYDVRFRGIEAPANLTLEGAEELGRGYDGETHELSLRVRAEGDWQVSLALPGGEPLGRDKKEAIYRLLQRAQIPYGLKSDIYKEVCRDQDTEHLLARLIQLELDAGLMGAVTEQIVCDR